jgi:hypothetical protein
MRKRTKVLLVGIGTVIALAAAILGGLAAEGNASEALLDSGSAQSAAAVLSGATYSPWPDAPGYRQEGFAPVVASADTEAMESVVRQALELENQAMLGSNYAQAGEFKSSLESIYANDYGYLDNHKMYIDVNRLGNEADGYVETTRETVRVDFKEVQVADDKARVIVEQEHLVVRVPVTAVRSDGRRVPTLTVRSGRQLDILLEKTAGKWVIYADRFELIPGMEPGSHVEVSFTD